ncbi:mRNA-capping enzyme subunit beta [Orbilia javanica]|uniref:mRNA-capping enzyme subunit beta n=1 Tax=Orbilia javanica TaxID=47235 RepID=A0AAN8MSM2_9PEZI
MDLRSIMNDSSGAAARNQPPTPHPPQPSSHPYHRQQSPIQQPPNAPPPNMNPSNPYHHQQQQQQHYPGQQHLQHHAPPPHHYGGPGQSRPAPPPLQPPKSPFQPHSNAPPQQGPPFHHRKSSGGSQPGYPFPSPSARSNSQGQHPYGPHVQNSSPYSTPHPLSAQSGGGSPFTGPPSGGHHPGSGQQLTPTSATSYGSPYGNQFPTMSPMGTPGPGYPPPPQHQHPQQQPLPPQQQQQQQQRGKPQPPPSHPHAHTPTTPNPPSMAGSPIHGGGGVAMSPSGEARVGKVRERMFAERRREREMEEMQSEQRERDRIDRERERERDLSISPKTRVPMYIDDRKESLGGQKEDWAAGRTNENYSLSQSPISQRMNSGTPAPPGFPPPAPQQQQAQSQTQPQLQQQGPGQRSQPPTPTHGPQAMGLPSPRHPPPSPQRFPSAGYSEKMDIDSRSNSEARPSNGEQTTPQWAQEGQVKTEKKVNGFDSEIPPHLAPEDETLTSSRLNMGPPSNMDETSSNSGGKPLIKEEPGTQIAAMPPMSQQSQQQPSPPAKRSSFPTPARPQPGQIQVPVNAQPPQPGSAASPIGPSRKRPRHDEPPIFARKASRSSSSSPVIQNRRQPPPGPSAMSQQQPLTPSAPSQPPANFQNQAAQPQPQPQQQSQNASQQSQNPMMPQQQPPQPQQQQQQQQQQQPQQQQSNAAKPPPVTSVLGPWEPSITNIQPYEELTKHICDFLFIHVIDNQEFQLDDPDKPQLEIEAKIGILVDRNTGQRLYLPVKTETILDSDDPGLKVMFKSSMTELQHKRMNEFLNRTFAESQRQAAQGQQPPGGDYPAITTPRIPLTYKHLRERDSFFEIPDDVKDQIPMCIKRVPNYHYRLKLRVTHDQKTGRVLNKIVKARIADLNIFSPRTAFDWRISVNMEMPWKGDIERLVPQGGGERNKDRLSYQHLCFSVDLTQVTAAAGGGPQGPKKEHELEIEVDARKVREQGRLIMERKPNGFQDLVRGFVDNVRVLARELGEPGYQ